MADHFVAAGSDADDQVVRALADYWRRTDPAPANVVAAAKASFTWRTIDQELVELVFDSSAESELVAFGAAASAETSDERRLVFESGALRIEMAVSSNDGTSLVGSLSPPARGEVVLRHPDGAITSESDDEGRFSFDHVPVGPICLRAMRPGGGAVQTDWVLI
ncbi:MAG: hypothetical protein ACKVWR_09450 [Acidimicrobiales bacterium]